VGRPTHSTAAAWIASARESRLRDEPELPGPAFTIAAGESQPRRDERLDELRAGERGGARRGPPRQALAPPSRSASTSASLLSSMRMPVSLAASRAFWPFFADRQRELVVGTMTSAGRLTSGSLGSVITTDDTFAGDSARATMSPGRATNSMMSIFSPCSSRLMTWMRVPRNPTHAPMGSTPSAWLTRTRPWHARRLPRRGLHQDDASWISGISRLERDAAR